MAGNRERADQISPQQGTSVLRAGVWLVAPEREPPYDASPEELTSSELFAAFGKALHIATEPYSKAFKNIGVSLARASGKVQGQNNLVGLLDEVNQYGASTKEGEVALRKLQVALQKQAKQNKPKGLRIPEREPYYVKLTKQKRR